MGKMVVAYGEKLYKSIKSVKSFILNMGFLLQGKGFFLIFAPYFFK